MFSVEFLLGYTITPGGSGVFYFKNLSFGFISNATSPRIGPMLNSIKIYLPNTGAARLMN